MSGIMNMLLGARTAIAAAVDEFFNRVTLLLPGDGTNGAQNNTFLDSSTNNFTITRNGNTTQGTFSPFSQTGWSNYFGGSTDYVAFTSIAAYGVGTGNFSVQLFVNFNSTSGNQRMFCVGASGTDGINIQFAGGSTQLQIDIANTRIITHTWTPVVGTWYQIDVVRAGTSTNQTTLYINGSSVATGTSSGSVGQNAANIGGLSWNSSFTVNGYVSNVRFSNNARSISAVTTSYSSDANTLLLTSQSNRFVDNSSTGNTFAIGGTPSIQAFSPFAPTVAYSAATVGGSGYFDGTGDYLTWGPGSSIAFGTGDFTVETWIYPTGTGNYYIIDARNSGQTGAWAFHFTRSTNNVTWFNGSADWSVTASVIANQWNHIAYVRSGTTGALYLNGSRISTQTDSTNYSVSPTTSYIGTRYSIEQLMLGYTANTRILKGTAQYSGTTYTVPTAPLTAITNTQLLTNFTNAGITDATAKNDLETVGNAQISTTQSKFGGSSMSFDGTGDYLRFPNGSFVQFNAGDFTIEAQLYLNTTTGNQTIIDCRPGTAGNYILLHYTSNSLNVFINGSTVITGGSLTANVWNHIALARSGTSMKLFVNGTQVGSTATNSTNFANPGNGYPFIGSNYVPNDYLNGFLDDLRITNGVARYTANFTAPTSAFALQ